MNPTFDDRDAEILAKRQEQFDSRQGPRVGDIVRLLDGTERRFTHDWGDSLQVSGRWSDSGEIDQGSFYFAGEYCSYSGSLDPSIAKTRFKQVRTGKAPAWFFHHDCACAHNGVYVQIDVRIFAEVEAA